MREKVGDDSADLSLKLCSRALYYAIVYLRICGWNELWNKVWVEIISCKNSEISSNNYHIRATWFTLVFGSPWFIRVS